MPKICTIRDLREINEQGKAYKGISTSALFAKARDYFITNEGVDIDEASKHLFIYKDKNDQYGRVFGYDNVKEDLVNNIVSNRGIILIGPSGTGKTYAPNVLAKTVKDLYDSNKLGERYHISNCKVREDANRILVLQEALKRKNSVVAIYNVLCPDCRYEIKENLGADNIFESLKDPESAVKKLDEIEIRRSEFKFEDFLFAQCTSADDVKEDLLYRINLQKAYSGADIRKCIEMGICADHFKLIILNEIHRSINEYGQDILNPLLQLLEKTKGRTISTPAGNYPVDPVVISNANDGINADIAILRRLGDFVAMNYPKVETERAIIKRGFEKYIDDHRILGLGATEDPVILAAMKDLGYENNFVLKIPELTIDYITYFAQETRPLEWRTEGGFELDFGGRKSEDADAYLNKLSSFMHSKEGKILDFLTTPDTLSKIVEPLVQTKFLEFKRNRNGYSVLTVKDIEKHIMHSSKEYGWKKINTAMGEARKHVKNIISMKLSDGTPGFTGARAEEEVINKILLSTSGKKGKELVDALKEYRKLWEAASSEAADINIPPTKMALIYLDILRTESRSG